MKLARLLFPKQFPGWIQNALIIIRVTRFSLTRVLVTLIGHLAVKMKKQSKRAGFTLIEILVSISIVITTTTIIVAILTSSFRGISKSNISEDVRQNGNNAISRMSRLIQYAQGFRGASTDDADYEPSCLLGEGKNYQYIKVLSAGQEVKLSCNNLSVGTSPLIDITKVRVVAGTCSFTCTQASDASPIIGISFDLSEASASVPEKSKTIHFSTTVKMRNQ